jgi:hypothetical protein
MVPSTIFTIILLTVNHLYSTFASPVVSKGGLGDCSLDLAHTPAKQASPPDQLCEEVDVWKERMCVTSSNDREWMDVCIHHVTEYEYNAYSRCPLDTMCMNVLGPGPEHNFIIVCLERPSAMIHTSLEKQMGVFKVSAGIALVPVERTVDVRVAMPIDSASVSAYLEGMY